MWSEKNRGGEACGVKKWAGPHLHFQNGGGE